jgi:hypothetical protein
MRNCSGYERDALNRRSRLEAGRLLQRLMASPAARLAATEDGHHVIHDGGPPSTISSELVRLLAASGLLQKAEPGKLAVNSAAKAWLRRQTAPADSFRAQHQSIEAMQLGDEEQTSVLVNRDESPIGTLARHRGRRGEPWLAPYAATAAERLRRDFEIGRLQPRITANWSASVNTDRRTGDAGGLGDLTDMALAARLRLDRAIAAVGPEFSGVLVDVCCFLKGLETVERERQWPARSAKLVLRLALDALARHYGLGAAATGKPEDRRIRHWGADDYRPDIT